MIAKLGVTSLASLESDHSLLGYPKRFALGLYGEIIESHPELDDWLAKILERHRTHGGGVKRTHDRRFADLDEQLAARVAELRTRVSGPLRVHDLAVSDGRTTAELQDRLAEFGPLDWMASDRDLRVDVVAPHGSESAVVFDQDGHVVQYVGRGFVLSPSAPENPYLYPVNRVMLRALEARLRAKAEAALREATAEPLADLEHRDAQGHDVWRVPLICRSCLERMASGTMRFERQDLLDPLPHRCHLLRAMNVLNPSMPVDVLRRAIGTLREGLEDGGLLVVGRTQDPGGETHATIWRREGDRLQILDQLHGGSEVAAQVEAGN